MPRIVLLGPQRTAPTLPGALSELGLEGPFAVVTAGWEDREQETGALALAVGRPLVNLRLFQAAEAAFGADRELFLAYRERRQLLRAQQEAYRLRLGHRVAARAAMEDRSWPSEVLEAERRDAAEGIRSLDRHHLERVTEITISFEHRWRPVERPAVASRRRRILEDLEGAQAVLIAGGHVPILLNRVRLFDLAGVLATKPVVAWSGGAMVTAEQVVLYHDSPPQGAGHPEFLGPGLGLVAGRVWFPDARRRLRLDDRQHLRELAYRLAPAQPTVLEEESGLEWTGRRWKAAAGGAHRILRDGSLGDALES